MIISKTPPASICAPELMAFVAGNGSLRVSADAIDQLIAEIIKAVAPIGSIGASPKFDEWLTSTATPAIPPTKPSASLPVSLWLFRITMSARAMNAGIVAIITAAIPDGTFCSAQNSKP